METVRVAVYSEELDTALELSTSMDAAVSFASAQGLKYRRINNKVESLLMQGGKVRIIVDLRLANTHPDFLTQVLLWQNTGLEIGCRYYDIQNGIFHPKLYIFHLKDGLVRVITGSANWTDEAYSANVEHGIVLEGHQEDSAISHALHFFEDLWQSRNSRDIDTRALEIYRAYWRRCHGLDRKSRTRVASIWHRLQEHLLAKHVEEGFQWPDNDAAFLLGAVAARGSIDKEENLLTIEFQYGGQAYRHKGRRGYIGKGDVTFEASKVVHTIPEAVANRVSHVVAPAVAEVHKRGKWTYELVIECSRNPGLLEELRGCLKSQAALTFASLRSIKRTMAMYTNASSLSGKNS